MRLICIAMDEGKCVICGRYDPSNDAHHLFYREQWKATRPQDLLTLCRTCHFQVHELGADITAKELWQKYKYLERTPVIGGCYTCGYDLPSHTIKTSKETDTYISLCGECAAKVKIENRDESRNPWVGIRKVKERFQAERMRRFYITILRKMVENGIEKQTEIDLFQLAIRKAGRKIRKFLLTGSVSRTNSAPSAPIAG